MLFNLVNPLNANLQVQSFQTPFFLCMGHTMNSNRVWRLDGALDGFDLPLGSQRKVHVAFRLVVTPKHTPAVTGHAHAGE